MFEIFGRKTNFNPSKLPGKNKELISKTESNMYGEITVTLATAAETLIPFQIEK